MNRSRCQSSERISTSHVTYCSKDEGHDGQCSFANGNGEHIWLTGYEIANLKCMFETMIEAPSGHPLKVFNSGDWFHELHAKLKQIYLPHNQPNKNTNQYLIEFEKLR